MKKIYILAAVISSILLSGCGKSKFQAPFTELTFESTMEEVRNTEGEEIKNYPSLYNGTTYVFNKSYLENEGTIKYMTDRDDNIMSVAWAYTSENEDALNLLYSTILSDLKKTYGEPENADGVNNFVEIWRLDEGHILLTAVNTTDLKALQLAYVCQAAVDYEAEDVEVDSVTKPLSEVLNQ